MKTPLDRVTKDIEEVKCEISRAQGKVNKCEEQLKAAVLAREQADILQYHKALLDSASQQLHDLRDEEGKLIERQTALETAAPVEVQKFEAFTIEMKEALANVEKNVLKNFRSESGSSIQGIERS